MTADIEIMTGLLDFARQKNPVWPMAACIVDEAGEVLLRAVNAAHISPTFHGEIVAINVLAELIATARDPNKSFTLFTTAECCAMCQSAIHWAQVTGVPIKRVVFGSTAEKIRQLWDFDVEISAWEIVARSKSTAVELRGPFLKPECDALFDDAKRLQLEINDRHPAGKVLSSNINDFFEVLIGT